MAQAVAAATRGVAGQIKDYLGDKIGLYFAWLSFYTSYMGVLGMLGLCVWAGGEWHGNSDYFGVTLYAVAVCVWSTLFLEGWKRRQAVIAFEWNTG